MKPALLLVALLFFGGCASSSERYLKNRIVDIPLSSFGEKSEKMEKGKVTSKEGPFPDDFPPSRKIILKDNRHYSLFDNGPVYAFPAYNIIRLYDLKGVGPNRTISRYIRDLKKALIERRSARLLEKQYTTLPDFPPRNAGHLVQDKVEYVTFPWGKGIFYLVAFTQGPGNFPNNDELIYTFQGISNDGRLYVAADFRVVSSLLAKTKPPSDIDAIDDAATAIARRLDKEPDSAFTPDLSTIRSWMEQIK